MQLSLNQEDYLQALRALAFITRFRILNLLYQRKPQTLSQQQIVDILEVPKSNISRHSKKLKNANLITQWKIGKHIYQAINPNLKIKSIMSLMKEYENNPTLKQDLKKLNKVASCQGDKNRDNSKRSIEHLISTIKSI